MEVTTETISGNSRKKRNLTDEERYAIHEILQMHKNSKGKIMRGNSSGANNDGSSTSVISRIPRNVGRRKIHVEPNLAKQVPWRRRGNLSSYACALGMSKSTLQRRVKEGELRRHSNAMKPRIVESNKKARLEHCLSMIDKSFIHECPRFIDMIDYVYIDEKWFFLSKEIEKYYALPDENGPYRTCQSKNFISRIMFLTAVARPCFDAFKNEMFDGKIGIFPLVYQEPAKHNSKNRRAGTLETKPIMSVTKVVSRAFLIHKVLPAIRAKWPLDGPKRILIQQDNARAHIHEDDPEFLDAAQMDGFNIKLKFQPPNSPDLNVLDLGYFRAISSLQHQEAPKTIDELIFAVEKSFNDLTVEKLNHVFLTLQLSMIEIMKVDGDNDFKLPHISKEKLEKNDQLPLVFEISSELVEKVQMLLQTPQ